MARRPRISEQISRLTRTLVAVQGWDKEYTMAYQGVRPQPFEPI